MTKRFETLQQKAFQKVSLVFGVAYAITLFIQFSDYIKSYILYIQAKRTLIDMYRDNRSVDEMNEQADIVNYLGGLSTVAIEQIFYITATFAFVAGIALVIIYLGKKA